MPTRWRNAKITPGGLTASPKTGRLRMNRSGPPIAARNSAGRSRSTRPHSRHASRVVQGLRRWRYGHRRAGTTGNAEGTSGNAPGNHTEDRQTDGRAMLRRVPLEKRQDSILQLLSVRHGDFDAIRCSSNLEMSVKGATRLGAGQRSTARVVTSLTPRFQEDSHGK
jgi:hypothetical protein